MNIYNFFNIYNNINFTGKQRGKRGGNKQKRNYFRQKYNPYQMGLRNLATYHVELVSQQIEKIAKAEYEKKKAKQHKSEDSD